MGSVMTILPTQNKRANKWAERGAETSAAINHQSVRLFQNRQTESTHFAFCFLVGGARRGMI
jgi:hypothetical protein